MTDTATPPYTDDDLRHEAARQHATRAKGHDFMGVGEAMEYARISSTAVGNVEGCQTGPTWGSALPNEADDGEAYSAAQRAVHGLITGAADTSHWAVQLGADGLEPSADGVTVDGDGKPLVRVHLAFHPDMDPRDRAGFVTALAQVMANGL